MRESGRDFWENAASRYDRVAKGLLGRPLPRAVELTRRAVAGSPLSGDADATIGERRSRPR